jgi:hypothetical protein
VVLALSSVAGAMAISSRMAEARRGERQAYARALAEREAAAAEAGAESGAPAGRSRTLCMRGADTVVARVARFLDSRLVDGEGRLDVSALVRTSRRAAELDRSGALPQRMGRRRAAPAPDGTPTWEPIEPPERICVELAELAVPGRAQGNRRAAGAK